MRNFFNSKQIFKSQPPPVVPVTRAGYPFILIGFCISFLCAFLNLTWITILCLGLTLFVIAFFRDPERFTPTKAKGVISPADGKVIYAGNWVDTPFNDGPSQKISIFMSVFNVHVNRIPCDGKVADIVYYPGKFFAANLDKSSEENERNAVKLTTEDGESVVFVQIAGLIARRIISELNIGDDVKKGERFGMIRFGSRLDVYLPNHIKPAVCVGDKVKSGETIIARL